MKDSPKPPPRRGLESRSFVIVAMIVAVALAIFLFSTDDSQPPVSPQSPQEETPQEPAN